VLSPSFLELLKVAFVVPTVVLLEVSVVTHVQVRSFLQLTKNNIPQTPIVNNTFFINLFFFK